jgi:tRNA methyl transferase
VHVCLFCGVALTQMPSVVPLHCFGSKASYLLLCRMYVVGKDMSSNTVHVAEGGEHPALYAETALLAAPHWVAGAPPLQLTQVRATQADVGICVQRRRACLITVSGVPAADLTPTKLA